MRLRDDLAMTELILARVTQAEEEAALLQQGVADSRDEFPHDTAEDLKKLVKEDKRSLAPKYLIHSHSQVVHAVCKRNCLKLDPETWPRVCGWGWVVSQPCLEEAAEVRECHSRLAGAMW